MAEYRPDIIGTNHLTYNIPATMRHIGNLSRPPDHVMLECLDPSDTGKDFEIEIGIGDDEEIYLTGLRTNPNPFFRAMRKYFQAKNIRLSFAYSKEENPYSSLQTSEATEVSEYAIERPFDDLRDLQQKFNDHINPIILGRVLMYRPDIILIGSAHGEYLHQNISESTYLVVHDGQAEQAYMDELLKNIEHGIPNLMSRKK